MNREAHDPNSSGNDLELFVVYGRLLQRWAVVFALAAIGGVVGIVIGGAIPSNFRAMAEISIGVDAARSIWLDEDARNEVMFRVQSLLLSDQALDRTLQVLRSDQGDQLLPQDVASLRERLSLTRIESSWQMSAHAKTPVEAAEIANDWAEVALDEVETAVKAAARAGQLQSLFFQIACEPIEVAEAGIDMWACDRAQPTGSPADLPQDLASAAKDSHGLVPPMTYSFDQHAVPPTEPTAPAQPATAVTGLIVGLVGGTLWVIIKPGPARHRALDPPAQER